MKRISAADICQLKSTSQLKYLDGKIFFIENSIDSQNNRYQSRIKSIDSRGKIQTWTDKEGLNSDLTITENYLYFSAKDNKSEKRQLYRVDIKGGVAEQITNGKEDVISIIADPKGQNIIYESMESSQAGKFKTKDFPETRQISRLKNKLDGYGWFDEKVEYKINLFDSDDKRHIQLERSSKRINLLDLSKDGKELIISKDNKPDDDLDFGQGIYSYDLDSKKLSFITSELPNGYFFDAKLSPDKSRILIAGNDRHLPGYTKQELYVYDKNKQILKNLSREDDFDLENHLAADFSQQRSESVLAWADNEKYIFAAGYHGRSQLFSGSADGYHLIYDEPNEIFDFALLNNKKIALSISKQEKANEIIQIDFNENDASHISLYDPNEKFDNEHLYAKSQHFIYKSDDGLEHDGWYLHAVEPKNPKKIPVLLYIHGGPHAAYGETFFHEFQTHAAQGYAVIFVNPRGSTTYGQSFESAVIGHYGEQDFSDVINGLDFALNNFPELDRDRQYIAGGSYGGFMTSWAVGHTQRFKAAITQRSVINWISLWGTSDIGWYFNKRELGIDLYDAGGLETYWQKSPLAYADHISTPLLIQHGEWDMRCPIEQSEQLFTAVKKTGNETKFIRYPQSFHGISRNGLPSLRIQRLKDIDEWLGKH